VPRTTLAVWGQGLEPLSSCGSPFDQPVLAGQGNLLVILIDCLRWTVGWIVVTVLKKIWRVALWMARCSDWLLRPVAFGWVVVDPGLLLCLVVCVWSDSGRGSVGVVGHPR
jgi:hypothetical protein